MVSLLGPHVIRPTGDALDWSRVAPVVKALDDTTALRQASRATVRIFRRYFPVQDVGRPGGAVVAEVLAALGDAPATHVELFNEVTGQVGAGLARYVDFTREAVAELRRVRPDLTLVAFSFSTGTPGQDAWVALREQGYGGASCIGLHQYWGNQGFTVYHALRHRLLHAWAGGDHPPFLVTECGRDRVEGGRGGWRADGIGPEQYHRELLAYEQELLKDPDVLAATPFTAGSTPDWSNFDTDPLSGWLVAEAGPLPTPPEEPPVATTTKGIDVSNHQGAVDWPRVAAAGYRFAGLKASGDEGDGDAFVDPFFPEHWAATGRLEMGRIAYHYARPSRVAPAQSVTTLERALAAVGGLRAGDNVALDVEDPAVPDGVSLHVWVAEWLDLAARVLGIVPFKYSARYYTSTHDLEHADLARYPTWWASSPPKPAPVAGWGPIRIHQFDWFAAVPGVTGPCDANVFDGALDALRALGKPAPPAVDWETPVFGPIYRGAAAVGGMPDKTDLDELDAREIIRRMDSLKSRHA